MVFLLGRLAFWIHVAILALNFISVHTFILNGVNVSSLPQFSLYGKNLVLVGGNLHDNNSEIYNTIINMAVSITSFGELQMPAFHRFILRI